MENEKEIDITNLELLSGVGSGTAQKMRDGGILTILSVATSTPGQMSDACGTTASAARKLINAARDLCKLGFELGIDVKKKQSETRYIPTYCESIDKLLGGGLQLGTTMEAFGQFSCLTGDTEIYMNRNYGGRKYKLKYLYKQFNKLPTKYNKQWDLTVNSFVRSFNGDIIKLHKINTVVYSGKKKVWKLKLKDGKEIKATGDHKILTDKGWKELQKLDIKNDLIMCDNPKTTKSKHTKVNRNYNFVISKPEFHPYISGNGNGRGRRSLEIHRATYEAHINNLTLNKYLHIIFNDEEKANILKYIDPDKYHIHHKDLNHFNNDISNLECMEKIEHLKLHGKKLFINFGQGIPIFVNISSITELDVQDTYDIVCDDPHHNFVANGIVVHNSGKTNLSHLLAVSTIKNFPTSTVIWIDTENTFSAKRIEQFCKGLDMNPEEVLKRIKVGKSVSSDHQILLTESVEKEIIEGKNDVKLIIVDSLMNHFRAEYLGRGTLANRQQTINGYLHKIATLVANYGTAVYMTNQVQFDPGQAFGNPEKAVGGAIVGHFATVRVWIVKAAKGTRRMKLVDSPDLPEGEADFKITETCLESIE